MHAEARALKLHARLRAQLYFHCPSFQSFNFWCKRFREHSFLANYRSDQFGRRDVKGGVECLDCLRCSLLAPDSSHFVCRPLLDFDFLPVCLEIECREGRGNVERDMMPLCEGRNLIGSNFVENMTSLGYSVTPTTTLSISPLCIEIPTAVSGIRVTSNPSVVNSKEVSLAP